MMLDALLAVQTMQGHARHRLRSNAKRSHLTRAWLVKQQ